MKIGIDIPITAKENVILDEANGNTVWKDIIKLYMRNSHVAFNLCEKGDKAPVGHTKINCHLIFDLRPDMTRNARYFSGGYLTDFPTYMTYSSVVSRDKVHIGFLMSILNNLDVLARDIQDGFLEAPTK